MPVLLRESTELRLNESKLQELRELNAQGKPVTVIALLTTCDQKNGNGRIYPFSVFKPEADRYLSDVVKKGYAIGECVDKETEILTSGGWKYIKDIRKDEIIATLNVQSNQIEYHKINEKIELDFNGKLIHFTNNNKLDMMLTPNHKLLLWDRYGNIYKKTALEIVENFDSTVSHSFIKNSGEWVGSSPDCFQIPNTDYKISINTWAALFGLFLAEGWASGTKKIKNIDKATIGITQKKINNIEPIRQLLKDSGLPWIEKSRTLEEDDDTPTYDWTICDKNIHNYFYQFGNSEQKFIPQEFLMWNKESLQVLLDWMLLGDGRNRKDRNGRVIIEYSTISKRLANNVSELVFKLGYGSYIKEYQETKNRFIKDNLLIAENCKKLYTTAANISNTHFDKRFVSINMVDYNDKVYCVNVKNNNWLMRRNNKVAWTGNCDHDDRPEVSVKNASHVIDDMWWNDEPNGPKQLFGKIRLLNTPMGQIAKEIVLSGIPLGISSRAVGSVQKDSLKEADVVQPDFHLITYDLVATPSNPGSFLKLSENKQINFNPKNFLPSEFRVKEALLELLKK